MKLSRKAPGLIVAAVSLVLFLYLSLAWWQIDRNARLNAEENLHWMVALLRSALDDTSTRALAQAEMITMAPALARAVEANDRAALLRAVEPIFTLQHKKYGLDQLNFYTPEAVAWLRAQAPDEAGDRLNLQTSLVGQACRRREPVKGVEVARTGPAVFGVSPLLAEGRLQGVCAVGMQFNRLLEQVHQDFGVDAAALFSERRLRSEVAGYQPAPTSDVVSGFARVASTDWELCQQVLQGTQLSGLHDPLTFLARAHDTDYGVAVVPMRDVQGTLVGHLVATRDFGRFGTRARRARVMATVASLFVVVTLAGVVLVVVNGMLLRPLQDLISRLQARQRGEDPPPPEPHLLERRDELGDLARVYQQMHP